jgi:hypothetical protein
LALAANFIGLVLIYLGLTSVLGKPKKAPVISVLTAWWLFCLIGLTLNLFAPLSVVKDRAILFSVAFIFFIPIRLLIFTALSFVWTKEYFNNRRNAFIGAVLVQISVAFNLANYAMSIRDMLFYPKNFWFIAIVDDKLVLFLGILASIFLVCGMFYVFKSLKIKPSAENL